MMQENLNTVEICAEAQAFPFHYKSGFRVKQMQIEISKEKLNKVITNFAEQSGIDKETLERAVVLKTVDEKLFVHSQTYETFSKLLYLKNNGKYIMGDTPMDLHG